MRKIQLLVSVLLLFLFLVACAPTAAPSPAPAVPAPVSAPAAAPAVGVPAAPAKPAWEVEWEKTLEAAKKEGRVMILTSTSVQVRQALTGAFKSIFGISIESIGGTTAELPTKILAERRAGIHTSDVGIMGALVPPSVLKPAGALERLEPVLFLPELTNQKEIQRVWRLGELDWIDQDHTTLAYAAYVKIPFVLNSDLVKPGEIKAYRDLLNPKWKGKIVITDPTLGAGPGASAMQVLPQIMSWDYLRQLVQQQPFLSRDKRQLVEWVVRGKYAVGLLAEEAVIKEFLDVGAPLTIALAEEGSFLVAGSSVICLIKDAPHPNAAKLFINWLLSREGQIVYSTAHGTASERIDVSIEGLLRETIPDPSKKYLRTNTEAQALNMTETMKTVREVFAPLKQ